MFIKQVSVFVENTPGSASDIIDTLSKEGINIRALAIADTSEYGIMRLIADDPDRAKAVLLDRGIMVKRTRVFAVPLEDKPGGLAEILHILKNESISVEYMYAFVGKNHGKAVVVIKTDNTELTEDVLKSNNISTLCTSELI